MEAQLEYLREGGVSIWLTTIPCADMGTAFGTVTWWDTGRGLLDLALLRSLTHCDGCGSS